MLINDNSIGVPLDQCARSQSNLVIKKIHTVHPDSMKRFSNSIIPMFWIEIVSFISFPKGFFKFSSWFQHQPDLTPLIVGVIHFTINILPELEQYLGPLFILTGVSILLIIIVKFVKNRNDTSKRSLKRI